MDIHPGSSAVRITDEQDTKGSDEKDARLFFFQVSWVRHRDIHLLTVGVETYTSDQRFVALHFPHTEDWALQVKYPQRRDSGTYECQVSTTPPIGHSMLLSVVGELYLSLVPLFSSCFSPRETVVLISPQRGNSHYICLFVGSLMCTARASRYSQNLLHHRG